MGAAACYYIIDRVNVSSLRCRGSIRSFRQIRSSQERRENKSDYGSTTVGLEQTPQTKDMRVEKVMVWEEDKSMSFLLLGRRTRIYRREHVWYKSEGFYLISSVRKCCCCLIQMSSSDKQAKTELAVYVRYTEKPSASYPPTSKC